jgi:hypothetical protein
MKSPTILSLILLLINLKASFGYINFLLDSNETNEILGQNGAFFYVYEGSLRLNSVNYPIELPLSKNRIVFTWKALQVTKNRSYFKKTKTKFYYFSK